jgi:glycosyltransferase involved in cell wall biosynthesis
MSRLDISDLPIPIDGRHGWPWGLPESPAHLRDAPRITIVTPSFNQGQFIEETIRSVLLQGYPNLEYIIIDGGSTDESVAIIEKYAPWLKFWVSEKDRGQSHAINKGFLAATGQIYCYLNSDDVLFPGTLHRVAQRFSTSKPMTMLCCAGEFFGPAMADVLGIADTGGEAQTTRKWVPQPRQRLTDWLTTYASVMQQSCFWDSRLHAAIGQFSETLNFCFDKEFFLRAIFEFDGYVPCAEIIAAGHRLHDDCKTATIPEVMGRENELLWARYLAKPWCQTILRREDREERSYQLMANALSEPTLMRRSKNLAKSAVVWPGTMRSRMFWGAVSRIFDAPRTDA